MMFEHKHQKTRNPWQIGSSVALHGAFLLLLLTHLRAVRVRPSVPGTLQGTRIELTYLPGGAASAEVAPVHRKVPVPPKQKAEKQPLPVPAPMPVPADAAPSSGKSGAETNDALGTEDIQIALTTYSPSPRPDLSQVPHGAQGDVVLDITIDPTGKVADLQILHALGYGVEGTVADTVRTWTFRPATKDGIPVASMQELHFHYGPV